MKLLHHSYSTNGVRPSAPPLRHESGTAVVDPAEVFREALKAGASKIIVAHNHPSGDLTPSKADIDTTARLRAASNLLGVQFLDHLILGKDSRFVSISHAKDAKQ